MIKLYGIVILIFNVSIQYNDVDQPNSDNKYNLNSNCVGSD
jgi:hypothetical protein